MYQQTQMFRWAVLGPEVPDPFYKGMMYEPLLGHVWAASFSEAREAAEARYGRKNVARIVRD